MQVPQTVVAPRWASQPIRDQAGRVAQAQPCHAGTNPFPLYGSSVVFPRSLITSTFYVRRRRTVRSKRGAPRTRAPGRGAGPRRGAAISASAGKGRACRRTGVPTAPAASLRLPRPAGLPARPLVASFGLFSEHVVAAECGSGPDGPAGAVPMVEPVAEPVPVARQSRPPRHERHRRHRRHRRVIEQSRDDSRRGDVVNIVVLLGRASGVRGLCARRARTRASGAGEWLPNQAGARGRESALSVGDRLAVRPSVRRLK